MKKAILFSDEGKDLRITYPELNEVSEFKPLSSSEMLFVYYFACESSPYIRMDIKNRLLKSLEHIKKDVSGSQIADYSKGEFPDKIKAAVDRMARYDVSARMKAREITEMVFKNVQELVDVDLTLLKDIDEKKRYIDMAASTVKLLPSIVSQLENGYGIRYVEDEPQEEIKPASKIRWEDLKTGSKK
jgi:hypothetical protein